MLLGRGAFINSNNCGINRKTRSLNGLPTRLLNSMVHCTKKLIMKMYRPLKYSSMFPTPTPHPLPHPSCTLRCNSCSMCPLEGPRYHCQVCADFDFCQACFEKGQSHNHAFERIDDQGQPAVFVGSPRSRRRALR